LFKIQPETAVKTWELDAFGMDQLHLRDRPDAVAGPGQVLIKMAAFSLNYRDLMVVKGQYNPRLRLPFVPLSDGVGEIVALGAGVTQWRVGQRVAPCFMPAWVDGEVTEAKGKSALGGGASGVAAERVAMDAQGIVAVPEHLTAAEAATLPCAAVTAWHALVTSGGIKAGDTVLIQGTGGVSLFALQFAKLHGARVIGTSSSHEKLARLASMGVEHGINYRETSEWGEAVRKLSDDVGVDHVVEVGGAGTLAQSFRAVRMGGRIALIGVLTGGTALVNPIPVLMRNLRVQGIFVGSRAMFVSMNKAIAAAKMKPVVDRVFGFAELPAALAHLESGKHFGKVCVEV